MIPLVIAVGSLPFFFFIYMHNDKTRILFNNTKTNNCAGEEKKPKGLI